MGASRPVVVAEGIVGEASVWSVRKQRRIVESAIEDVSPLDGQGPCLSLLFERRGAEQSPGVTMERKWSD